MKKKRMRYMSLRDMIYKHYIILISKNDKTWIFIKGWVKFLIIGICLKYGRMDEVRNKIGIKKKSTGRSTSYDNSLKDIRPVVTYLDPNSSHVAGQCGQIWIGCKPISKGHHDIQCGQTKHSVEEGPGVCYTIFFVIPHVMSVPRLRIPWTT